MTIIVEEPPLIDPRLRARRIGVARDRGRRRLRRIMVGVVLSVLILAGYGVTRSALLDVDRIEILGLSPTEAAMVEAVLEDVHGQPMVWMDLAELGDRVANMAWVADATVTRRWPGGLEVNVRARPAVAQVGEGPGAVAVDAEGRVLGSVAARALPVIDPSGRVPEPGAILGAEDRSLAAVLARLPDELRPEVGSAVVRGASMILVLNDGIEVSLGDGNRLQAKATALLALLEQADRATMATVDVSGVPGSSTLTRITQERA